ncbi:hypothetical protein L7F22_003838 [Adiantum nelumboides]|nr:hypothetical protein [Adiantum nelumboides]
MHFAHGFTWQKCKGAEDSEGLGPWAVYAEGVIKMLRQQKTLNRKLEKWRSTNGPCLGSEWKFNAKNMPNYTDSTGTSFDWQMYSGGHQFSWQAKEDFLKKRAFGSMGTFGMSNVSLTTFFASTADVAAISNMKANAAEKFKEKEQCLEAIKIALDQSKTKRDEQVGLMQGAAKIIERLNKDMEELKLHKAGLVPNKEAMAKLETLMQIRKEALKDMGLDIEVHNLDNLAEEAAQLQTVVTGVYMLWCQHPYHPLCFVTACKSDGHCLFHGCEEPLKDALKLLAPGEANMDEHVGTEKDPMEGIFGSPLDGIAGSSRKPNIDSMCGGCGDKNASQKQAGEDTLNQQKTEKRAEKRVDVVESQGDASKESAEVPLKPELAMNKDVEDAEKSSEKPIEKDTTMNLSDEDADLLISNVCGSEILGRRKKRSNTEERATPKKKAKVASEPPEPTPRDVQELDETVEDIAAKQNAKQNVNVTPDKVEEDQEPVVCPKIEEWGYLVSKICKIKKLIILDLNGLFVNRDVSKRDPKTGQFEHPPHPASDRVNIKRMNEKLWIYYRRDVEQFVWDLRKIADAMIWSSCTAANIELILRTCWPDIWEHRTYYFRYLFSDWQCEKWSYFEEIAKAPRGFASKPVFFKSLHHVWNKFPEYDSSRTLLVDDSRYKNMRNVWDNCICPLTFDPLDEDQDPDYLTRTLLPWLCRWALTPNFLEYTKANPISNPKDELLSLVFEHFVINGDE